MIEITVNDRLGKKVRIKCNEDDTIGDLKKLIAAQTGTRWSNIGLFQWKFCNILFEVGQDRAEEMVHNLQRPHCIRGLWDPWRDEFGIVLSMIDDLFCLYF